MGLINITVGLVSTAVTRGLNAIRGQFRSLREAANSELAGMLAFGGIVAGIGALFKNAFDKAAEMETLETGFTTLLKGADNAKARMKELADFAASTPFELPEVAKASRVLETLTEGALSTGDGLRLVGDVASATNQPFDEIAVHVGRLYAGLKGGRPVGEALARLMELGVVSVKTRQKIEDLQAEGKKGDEVWGIARDALGRFSGEMERQSNTWAGKMSNMQDNIGALFREFGMPIMDGLKPILESWIGTSGEAGSAARTAGEIVMWVVKAIQSLALYATLAFITIGKALEWLGKSTADIVGGIASSLIALFNGDFSGAKNAILGIGTNLKQTAKDWYNDMDAYTKGIQGQLDEIWAKPEAPKADAGKPGGAATPMDQTEIEETKKIRDMKEKMRDEERKHQIDQLKGEAKINAMIEERNRLLALANETTSDGLQAARDAQKMQWDIDEERDKHAQRIIDAKKKEQEAQEDLAISQMDEDEKRVYYAKKRDDLMEAAQNYENAGLEEEAIKARTEALEWERKMQGQRGKSDVVVSSIQKIGGGGAAYLGSSKPEEEVARNTAASKETLRRVEATLRRIEEFSKRPPTWKP